MSNEKIIFPEDIEQLRQDLIAFIEAKQVKQKLFCKLTGLSGCSISLFISSKRLLVPDKIEIIKNIIYQ